MNELNGSNLRSGPKQGTTLGSISFAAAAGGFGVGTGPAKPVDELIGGIKSTNDAVSSAACDSAPEYGLAAVRPLAFTMGDKDAEVARKAKRALYKLVHHAGRPGAAQEAIALEARLLALLHSRTPLPLQARREVLWMISQVGTPAGVPGVSGLLSDKELREDARCVLQRLPFPEAVAALRGALGTVDESFRSAVADALRARGEIVDGYPSKKMVPTGQTTVVELQPKK